MLPESKISRLQGDANAAQYWDPKSPTYRGDAAAAKYWKQVGKQPPGGLVAVTTASHRGPHIRIKAIIPHLDKKIEIIPDSGASSNLASAASCQRWGICIEALEPNEAQLYDIQGSIIPLVGKASFDISLPLVTHSLDPDPSLEPRGSLLLQHPQRHQAWP